MSLRESIECPLAANAFDEGCTFNRGLPKNEQLDLRNLANCRYEDSCNYPKTGYCRRFEEGVTTIGVSSQPSHPVNPEERFYGRLESKMNINEQREGK